MSVKSSLKGYTLGRYVKDSPGVNHEKRCKRCGGWRRTIFNRGTSNSVWQESSWFVPQTERRPVPVCTEKEEGTERWASLSCPGGANDHKSATGHNRFFGYLSA